jgi:hypothetical protein
VGINYPTRLLPNESNKILEISVCTHKTNTADFVIAKYARTGSWKF